MNPLDIPELLQTVCHYLDRNSLLAGIKVSRTWNSVCKPLLWETCSFSAEQYNAYHDVFDDHAPLIHNLEAKRRLIGSEMRFVAQHCVNLIFLTLRFCQVSPSSLDILCSGIQRVQYLTFDLCPGVNTTSIAPRLNRLPRLKYLEVIAHKQDRGSGTWRENDMVILLTQCQSLEHLKVVGADLSHIHLLGIQRHPTPLKLTSIHLVSTFIAETALKNLLSKSPNLSTLILLNNANKTSTAQVIAESCPSLQMLVLRNSKSISASAFDTVFKGCPSLTDIDISNTLIYDAAVSALCRNCPQLRVLNLRGCSRITHTSFLELMSTLSSLQHLIVGGCTKLMIKAFSGDTPWSSRENLEILEIPSVGINAESDKLDQFIKHLASVRRLKSLHLDEAVSEHPDIIKFLAETSSVNLTVTQPMGRSTGRLYNSGAEELWA